MKFILIEVDVKLIIIGEKINGSIPRTAKAVESRDEVYIR